MEQLSYPLRLSLISIPNQKFFCMTVCYGPSCKNLMLCAVSTTFYQKQAKAFLESSGDSINTLDKESLFLGVSFTFLIIPMQSPTIIHEQDPHSLFSLTSKSLTSLLLADMNECNKYRLRLFQLFQFTNKRIQNRSEAVFSISPYLLVQVLFLNFALSHICSFYFSCTTFL